MEIKPLNVTIRDLVDGYVDDETDGVRGYGGKLNIRPAYQREFVYADDDRDGVVMSVLRGFPLNAMYWVLTRNGDYEVLDGQQRIMSICGFHKKGGFSIVLDGLPVYFHSLKDGAKKEFLDYELMVYVCEGTDQDKLDWFHTINIAGKRLNAQELRNAIYSGPWVASARDYFSRPTSPARDIAADYLKGTQINQDYLETAIKWACGDHTDKGIKKHMSKNQDKLTAVDLWNHFNAIISWVEATFKETRSHMMQGVNWGSLYDEFKDHDLDPDKLEARIETLEQDSDIGNKKGIYPYVLTGDEKHLNIRAFSSNDRRAAYARQGKKCKRCGNSYPFEKMHGDHIKPWSKGGRTEPKNLQMLCEDCNRTKSDK